VDDQVARERLQAERLRIQDLLDQSSLDGSEERTGAGEQGDMSDSAEPLTAEEEQDAVSASLVERLSAIERAERRLEDGTYGQSILSGRPIPDDRLEADPAAELTVEEALEN
jgi:DnaK suppressor protein